MLKDIFLQIPRIDHLNFDVKITNEDEFERSYVKELQKNINRVNNGIQQLMSRQTDGHIVDRIDNRKDTSVKYAFEQKICNAGLHGPKLEEINDQFLVNVWKSGCMTILTITIDPTKLDYDTESELKFWIGDSKGILEDNSIKDKKIKIKNLPTRHLFAYVNDNMLMKMANCKIIKITEKKNSPYNIVVIVESIKPLTNGK